MLTVSAILPRLRYVACTRKSFCLLLVVVVLDLLRTFSVRSVHKARTVTGNTRKEVKPTKTKIEEKTGGSRKYGVAVIPAAFSRAPQQSIPFFSPLFLIFLKQTACLPASLLPRTNYVPSLLHSLSPCVKPDETFVEVAADTSHAPFIPELTVRPKPNAFVGPITGLSYDHVITFSTPFPRAESGFMNGRRLIGRASA